MVQSVIEIENLKKTFDGEEFVLKGINLRIPKDKITMIIGYSGTGKSVLLKHILGLHKATEGSVKVFGQDLSTLPMEKIISYRMRMGVLFQHAALFDDMTALENVLFPLQEHRRDLSDKQKLEIAEQKLESSGLDERHFEKLPEELSGGMRKRVGLARALALDPEILLYDEPTTGLDPILTEMVDNLILETHKKQKGSTSVVISHDLFAAFRTGDHIVMLDKGKVLLEGTPQNFLDSEDELVRKFLAKGLKKT